MNPAVRRALDAAVRRAADRLLNRLQVPPAGTPTGPWATAVVQAIGTGGGTDGFDLVTVTWRGDNYQASHLSSYTPVVGHTVLCAYNGAQLCILGRPIGTPPEV